MGLLLNIPNIIPNDWKRLDLVVRKIKLHLGRGASPTFTGLTITGLTASRLIATDASKALESTDLNSWVAGTANQITVTDDADGTITLSLPTDVIISGTSTPSITIESTDASDPTLIFKATNTAGGANANQINIYLDESGTPDNLRIVGQTASQDTQVIIQAQDGERARILLYSGTSNYGYLHYGAADTLTLANTKEDEDLVFGVNDGGTPKTITWDADVDKLKHSAGTFDFDDDHLTTTGNLTAATLTLSSIAAESSDVDKFLVDSSGVIKYRTGAQVLSDIGGISGPAGNDTEIQFNDSGSFGGDSGLTWNKTSNALTIEGATPATCAIYIKKRGAILFYDDDDSHVISIQSPNAITTSQYYRLPVADGTNGQLLTTDGSFNLSWTNGAAVVAGDNEDIQFNDGGAFGGSNSLYWDKNNDYFGVIGHVLIKNTHDIRFFPTGVSNYVGFKPPAAIAASKVWVLPAVDGSANEVLGTDGSETLIWRTHDEIDGFVANEHTDHTSVTLTAGTGLTGGGDISANRTFAVDGVLEDLDTLGTPASDGQFIVATGAGVFAYESTTTARTSLGVGTGDSPAFAACSLGTGELTCGSINRASGTLTIEINGTAEISISTTTVTLGGNLIIPDNGTIGSASDTDVMTIDASGNCTFSVFPITPSAAPDADYEVANKKYVDDNAVGVSTWIALTDTDPANYTGQAGNTVVVNAGEDGLEFGAAPGGTFSSKVNAYLGSNQTINSATWTTIAFDTENYDTDSEFDIVTNKGRFTPSVTGYYHISAKGNVYNLADQETTYIRIAKNAALTPYFEKLLSQSRGAPGATDVSTSGDIYLTTSDYIVVQLYQNNAGAQTIDGREKMTAVQIHRIA